MELSGKRVVVTGKIGGESRATAEQKLREAGALVQSSVTRDTDLLVTGEKVGPSKMKKAAALGVEVVTWEAVWSKSPIEAAGLTVDEAAEAQEYVERTGYDDPFPRQIGPMLAKAGDLPTGEAWSYEIKWDGYRCIATVKDGKVWMQSRSGKSEYREQFPHIAEALSRLPDCVIDGELVVLDENAHSVREALGNGGKGKARFIVFDVLESGGDLRSLPLTERREALEELLNPVQPLSAAAYERRPLAVSPAFDDGDKLLAYVKEKGLEGLVAKRRTSTYREGTRTDAWTKVKVRNEQEFVVVGWKPGEGKRSGAAGSLLLAVNDEPFDGPLTYVGRVGTGTDLWEAFTHLPTVEHPPIDTAGLTRAFLRDVTWVAPVMVVQVKFQTWTEDGRLWHPSLIGVRTDKSAADVRREP